jgi:hypothetical protein
MAELSRPSNSVPVPATVTVDGQTVDVTVAVRGAALLGRLYDLRADQGHALRELIYHCTAAIVAAVREP